MTKLDIQQSILEIAYQPALNPSTLDVQQSILEVAYQPILEPSILDIQQSILEVAYLPILEVATLETQQSLIEIAYIPNKIYETPLAPVSDVHNSGSWSGSFIYSAVESTGGSYILSPLTPSGASFEIQFPQITNYNSGNNLVIHADITKVTSGSLIPTGNGDTINLTFDLIVTGNILETFSLSDVRNFGMEYFFASGITRSQIQDNDIITLRVTANTTSVDVSNPRHILIDYIALGIDADIITPEPIPLMLIKTNTIIYGNGKTTITVPG